MKKRTKKAISLTLCLALIIQIIPLQLLGGIFINRFAISVDSFARSNYPIVDTNPQQPQEELTYFSGDYIPKSAVPKVNSRSSDSGIKYNNKIMSAIVSVIKHLGSIPKYAATAAKWFSCVQNSSKLGPLVQAGTNGLQKYTNFGTFMTAVSLPLQAYAFVQQILDYNDGKIDSNEFSLNCANIIVATGYAAWIVSGGVSSFMAGTGFVAGVFAAGATFPIWATALWIAAGLGAPIYHYWDSIRPWGVSFVNGLKTTGRLIWSPIKTIKYFSMGVWDWIWGTGEVPSTGAPVKKPNIYLYSPEDMTVNVKIKPDDRIIKSLPLYPIGTGWNAVIKNGSINASNGYLFYEAMVPVNGFQKKYGFILHKDSLSSDMEKLLEMYNFSSEEKIDFIEYWSDELEGMGDAVFYPQPVEVINAKISLDISPIPEKMYRVWFYITRYTGIDPITPAKIVKFDRSGYYGVEWGGLVEK